MPKVSVNNDPLFEVAIFALNGASYRAVAVDASGQLVVALATGSTIKVTQDTAADLLATVNLATDQNVQARAHGYDGSNWRKLQQLWGYTDRWSEQVSNLSATAGTNTLTTAAVAAGYIHIAEQIVCRNVNTAPSFLNFYLTCGGVQQYYRIVSGPGANLTYTIAGPFVLKAGDTMSMVFSGCSLNDDIYLDVNGYKMKIND